MHHDIGPMLTKTGGFCRATCDLVWAFGRMGWDGVVPRTLLARQGQFSTLEGVENNENNNYYHQHCNNGLSSPLLRIINQYVPITLLCGRHSNVWYWA